jgi:transcriptional regulator with XRE-family HTH domain
MDYNQFKNEFLKDGKLREEFEKYDLALEVARVLIAARLAKNLTQEQLAKEINTKQSGVARAESGDYLPSLSFLNKIALFYKTELIPPKFRFMEETKTVTIGAVGSGCNSGLTVDEIIYACRQRAVDEKIIN